MHCHRTILIPAALAAIAILVGPVRPCRAEPAATQPPQGTTPAAATPQAAAQLNPALAIHSPVGPFTNSTTVKGKIPVDLSGVWLVVAHTRPSPEHAPDKFQSFAQIWKVTGGATADPKFTMLDLQLPAPIQANLDAAMQKLTPWQPTPEELASLKKDWASLPAYKEKNLNQPMFLTVEYTLADPDHYKDALPGTAQSALDGSTFAVHVFERYQPAPVPEGVNIAQLMGRDSLYAFKAKDGSPSQLDGGAIVHFTAAGPGFPVPLNFGGGVQMYKLGNAS